LSFHSNTLTIKVAIGNVMNMNFTTESEDNENTIEVLSSALNQIADIVNNKPVTNDNWNKIKRIIDQTNFEVDF
jgi:hypothetical protein